MHHLIFDYCMTTMKENDFRNKRKEKRKRQKGRSKERNEILIWGVLRFLAGERVIG